MDHSTEINYTRIQYRSQNLNRENKHYFQLT